MLEKEREKLLLQKLKEGDAASFDELYQSYHQKVYSFSYSYLRNTEDAEGVLQELFLTLWNKREEAGEIRNLNAWLFTVSFNLIRKIFRNQAIGRQKMEDYALTAMFEDTSTLSSLEFDDLMEVAESHIDRLPGRQKTILLMRMKDGLNSKEISQELGIKQRTVENHISSARTALRKVFKEENLISLLFLWMLLP
jgi:RNA polymerase sigma-70 factor (family 1)